MKRIETSKKRNYWKVALHGHQTEKGASGKWPSRKHGIIGVIKNKTEKRELPESGTEYLVPGKCIGPRT